MSETERNLKVAKECGLVVTFGGNDFLSQDGLSQLDAYTARILAERDAAHAEAISKLQKENEIAKRFSSDAIADLARAKQKLSSANAAIVMKDEALKQSLGFTGSREIDAIIRNAISTSPESLAAWEAEKLEPLRKQVALLINVLKVQQVIMQPEESEMIEKAIANTQATAEAYIAEHDAKVLEEAADRLYEHARYIGCTCHQIIDSMASELRAAAKKGK